MWVDGIDNCGCGSVGYVDSSVIGLFFGVFFLLFFFFVWLDAGVDLVAQWGAGGVNLNDVGCLMMVAMWVVLGL